MRVLETFSGPKYSMYFDIEMVGVKKIQWHVYEECDKPFDADTSKIGHFSDFRIKIRALITLIILQPIFLILNDLLIYWKIWPTNVPLMILS